MDDANKLLERLRIRAAQVEAMKPGNGINWMDYAQSLAQDFHELDKQMSNGAYLPEAWN
jgi:hypothetical protein